MPNRRDAHDAAPFASLDESARQDFVVSLRQHLTGVTGRGNYLVYKSRLEPVFVKQNGRPPNGAEEVRALMTSDPYYQFWSAAQRSSQEMIWDAVIDTVERNLPETIAKTKVPQPRGSLILDPNLAIPRYNDVYDIHLQPGGYHTEQTEDDVAAGAIYDLGVPLYGMGGMGPENNYCGDTLLNYLRPFDPKRRPRRILDLGCAIGNSTVPWAKAFPDAEVHGIDLAAPCLRYGHLRANTLGQSIHFSQQNAEYLNYEDNFFDIVSSALLLHETSRSAVGRILQETYRVLKPGGVMVHLDGFGIPGNGPLTEFLELWEVYNNNERFLLTLRSMDIVGLCRELGFDDARLETTPFGPYEPKAQPGEDLGYAAGFINVPVLAARK